MNAKPLLSIKKTISCTQTHKVLTKRVISKSSFFVFEAVTQDNVPWKGPQEILRPNTCFESGQVAPDAIYLDLKNFQEWRLNNLPGQNNIPDRIYIL